MLKMPQNRKKRAKRGAMAPVRTSELLASKNNYFFLVFQAPPGPPEREGAHGPLKIKWGPRALHKNVFLGVALGPLVKGGPWVSVGSGAKGSGGIS